VMKLIHGLFCDRPIDLCGGLIVLFVFYSWELITDIFDELSGDVCI